MRKLVKIEQETAESYPYGFFINQAIEDFRVFMHNAGLILSTHKRRDGSLIHNITQGQHDMNEKIPDIDFVGWGHWDYK